MFLIHVSLIRMLLLCMAMIVLNVFSVNYFCVISQDALVSPFRIVCMLKVGSASGRQVSPVIPEVSRRCDVTPEVETVTYRVYRVLSQQVCVLDKR